MGQQKTMGFGKHYHKTMQQVVAGDPGYMEWYLRQDKFHKKCPHILEYLLTFEVYRAYLSIFQDSGRRINVSKFRNNETYRTEIRRQLTEIPNTETQVPNAQNLTQKLSDQQLIDHLTDGDFDLVKVETDSEETGSGEPVCYMVRMFRGNDFVPGIGKRVLIELSNGCLKKGVIVGIQINHPEEKIPSLKYDGWVTSFINETAHNRYMVFRNNLMLDLMSARKAKKEADALRSEIEGLNGHAPADSSLETLLREAAAGVSMEEIFQAIDKARKQTNEELGA